MVQRVKPLNFDIIVLSRAELEVMIPKLEESHAVICITMPKELRKIPDNPNSKGVLYLQFFDIDFIDENTPAYGMFTKEHAKEILDFVYKVRASVDLLIFSCDAGRSRSAAVAAAIWHILGGPGAESGIFDSRMYNVNMHVYRTILDYHYDM